MRNSTAAQWLLLLAKTTALLHDVQCGAQWDQSSIFQLFLSHCAFFCLFCRFLTIFGLLAGAQWDQSSIFCPTVQFLSIVW